MPRASHRANGSSNHKQLNTNAIVAAVSDDESISDGTDVPESVPAKAPKAKGKAPVEPESEDELAEGSDDEEAEDEYSVEEIVDHNIQRGAIKYKVKWLGYDDEADMTWEPAENL